MYLLMFLLKVKEALIGAYQLNIQGLNVTVPYKEEIIPFFQSWKDTPTKLGQLIH